MCGLKSAIDTHSYLICYSNVIPRQYQTLIKSAIFLVAWSVTCRRILPIFTTYTEKYTPKYGGYCSIAVSEGILVEANPQSALVQNGELHVFYKDEEEDTQDEWKENPIENKKRAEIEWEKLM